MADDNPVDWSHISEIDRLFQYKRDAWVLACLHEGPLRHGELSRTIRTRMRMPLTATELGRALTHLREIDRIEHVKAGRVWLYQLTKHGATDAAMVVRILVSLRNDDLNTDDS